MKKSPKPRRKRSPLSDSEAFEAALRLLAVRDRSEAELIRRLDRKGFSEASSAAAIERCLHLGYLNDERFALQSARQLMRTGRAVGPRLQAELKARGIAADHAAPAIEAARQEFDEPAMFEELRQRRFPDFCYEDADDRQRRRVINYFLRRGFALSLILSSLKAQER